MPVIVAPQLSVAVGAVIEATSHSAVTSANVATSATGAVTSLIVNSVTTGSISENCRTNTLSKYTVLLSVPKVHNPTPSEKTVGFEFCKILSR